MTERDTEIMTEYIPRRERRPHTLSRLSSRQRGKQRGKRFLAVLLAAVLLACSPGAAFPERAQVYGDSHRQEMRAVWISTVWSVDFPSVKNNAQAQKQEYVRKLDQLQAAGINTVVVQVRPRADALYTSRINPWSDVLTGVQGKDPGYDPMAFMIEEAHKRGMSFHAWLNPYRITTSTGTVSGANPQSLAAHHPARLHPDWTIAYQGALYYNPELSQVKQHICDTVAEIVENYDVDGIHFDDYFYPSGYPLPEGENREGQTANARRAHVNEMVSMVYDTIKARDPSVLFGISPVGIWKNNSSDPAGSATGGNEGYYSVYGDAAAWVREGTVDYLVPQIYWKIGHSLADYETLVKWWANLTAGTDVSLYIGQAVYSDDVAKEIGRHLTINENYASVSGDFFFSAADILDNRLGCADQIRAYYNKTGQSGNTLPDYYDVLLSAWYAKDVQAASDLGIIKGKTNGRFDPSGNLTLAEAITLAVKTHCLGKGVEFIEGGDNWYDRAVAYAIEHGIIEENDFRDYNAVVNRETMAYIFNNALASDDDRVLNPNPRIPDIAGSLFQDSINNLYELGVLTGSGQDRSYRPYSNITRAEAAAIIHRLAVPDQRITFDEE